METHQLIVNRRFTTFILVWFPRINHIVMYFKHQYISNRLATNKQRLVVLNYIIKSSLWLHNLLSTKHLRGIFSSRDLLTLLKLIHLFGNFIFCLTPVVNKTEGRVTPTLFFSSSIWLMVFCALSSSSWRLCKVLLRAESCFSRSRMSPWYWSFGKADGHDIPNSLSISSNICNQWAKITKGTEGSLKRAWTMTYFSPKLNH